MLNMVQHGPARLRRWLRKRRQSYRAFARRVGCDHTYVAHMISGRHTPGLALAVRIELATEGAVRPADWVSVELGPAEAA